MTKIVKFGFFEMDSLRWLNYNVNKLRQYPATTAHFINTTVTLTS